MHKRILRPEKETAPKDPGGRAVHKRSIISRDAGPPSFKSGGANVGSALLLLVLRVFADHHDAPLALDDLALFADGLDRRSNLHCFVPPACQPLLRQVMRPLVRS